MKELDARASAVSSRERAKIDRTISRVRNALSTADQRQHARGDLSHSRKLRRVRAYRTLCRVGVGADLHDEMVERFEATGDERFLELIARDMDAVAITDVTWLLAELSDEYWRMRVIEYLIRQEPFEAYRLAEDHPFEVIYAIGRACVQSLAELVGEVAELYPANPKIAGIAAWAFGRLGERARLDHLYIVLREAGHIQ